MSDTEIEMEDCPDCEGSGEVLCEGVCDKCGKVSLDYVDCETCDGTGEVEKEE